MFCSDFYSVASSRLSKLTRFLASQIVNKRNKNGSLHPPTHRSRSVSSGNAAVCPSCVVVRGGFLKPPRGRSIYPLLHASSPHTQATSKANTEELGENTNRAPIVPDWGVQPPPTSRSLRMEAAQWCFANTQPFSLQTSFLRCGREARLLCSLRVCTLSCPIEAGMGKPFVARLRAAPLPDPFRPALTGPTSRRAGGQDGLLSDGCFLLALINRRQSPPAESRVLTKWISEKSGRGGLFCRPNCPTERGAHPQPEDSSRTPSRPRVQAAEPRTQTCIVSFHRIEKAAVSVDLHAWHQAGSALSASKLLFVCF